MIQCSKCGEPFAVKVGSAAVCLACSLLYAGGSVVPIYSAGATVEAVPHVVPGGRVAAIERGVGEWERWLLDAGQPAMRVLALRSYRREVVGLLLDALAGMGAITWTGDAAR